MSLIDELNQSLDNQDKKDDEIIETIKKINTLPSKIEERRKERETKRKFINQIPEELIEEYGPKLIQFERDNEKILISEVPSFLTSTNDVLKAVDSTSGSTTAYMSVAFDYIRVESEKPIWFDNAIEPFLILADYKSQKKEIPMKLNLLYCGLGEMFSEAFQSAEKAKLEIENQSNAIMAMRNFLQKSFWGNLLDNARRSKTSLWVGVQKNRLKNQETRSLVAKSLSNTDANERKLVDLLNNMAKLCNEMSDSKVGKNLAFNNIDYFNELNAEWLLLIDDIMKIIQIT